MHNSMYLVDSRSGDVDFWWRSIQRLLQFPPAVLVERLLLFCRILLIYFCFLLFYLIRSHTKNSKKIFTFFQIFEVGCLHQSSNLTFVLSLWSQRTTWKSGCFSSLKWCNVSPVILLILTRCLQQYCSPSFGFLRVCKAWWKKYRKDWMTIDI